MNTTVMTYEELVKVIEDSGRPYNMEMLRKAYETAAKAHGDQRRRSGEP